MGHQPFQGFRWLVVRFFPVYFVWLIFHVQVRVTTLSLSFHWSNEAPLCLTSASGKTHTRLAALVPFAHQVFCISLEGRMLDAQSVRR